LQEQFLSFFLGGVDDMATWSMRCWKDIVDWLENGVGPNSPLCVIEPANYNKRLRIENRRKRFHETPFWKKYGQSFIENVQVIKTDEGIYLKNKEPIDNIFQKKKTFKRSYDFQSILSW